VEGGRNHAARGKNKGKSARIASEEKRGDISRHNSPEATKFEHELGKDELHNTSTNPESNSLTKLK
jgi:hypothetical protein